MRNLIGLSVTGLMLLLSTASMASSLGEADPVLMYEEGMNYLYGRNGHDKDASRAAAYFRTLAEQEWSVAQNRLGEMYESGQGVPRDLDMAIAWYQRAAEQGHPIALAHVKKLKVQQSLTASR
jgi:TPR repeat protein